MTYETLYAFTEIAYLSA